jgi:hypothetical protein
METMEWITRDESEQMETNPDTREEMASVVQEVEVLRSP